MLIRIDNHSLVDDLCAHFVRSGYAARSVGGGMIEVTRPDTATGDQARREVTLHLRVWEIVNPGVAIAVVNQ